MRFVLFFLLLAVLGFSQNLSDFIVIDQFGYRSQAKKTAVFREQQPGEIEIIDENTGDAVHSGTAEAFNSGDADAASGDKIWHFDFSSVTTPGRYYVLDKTNDRRSFSFSIANDVYNNVLKAALRMLYYQRAGTDKPAQYAGETWADGMCFAQDGQTRDFFDKNNSSKQKDLKGGWFDAGDYNKYTKWAADYVENLLLAYEENPNAFADDYGIPESGNGVPDILDEANWGISWLLKMQNADGSVLSVQSLDHKSPPSAATGPSYYGPANATATYGAAKAFAVASRIFENQCGDYALALKTAAIKAWEWAEANKDSIFHNNCGDSWNKINCPNYDSRGLASGNQEQTDAWDRVENRINAAFSLYELTGENSYLAIFENNLSTLPLYAWTDFMDQYRHSAHMLYMRYLNSPHGTASVKSTMRTKLATAFAKSSDYLGAYQSDGYRSFIKSYNWGSNKYKTDYGLTFYKWDIVNSGANYKDIAEDYIHYIHGVNPFNWVYLTNMNEYGASKSLTKMYHTWFGDGANIQPIPGYLSGGPYEDYGLDGCCPSSCGSVANNAKCNLVQIPQDPPAKMYLDIDYSWPVNSWEITEPMIAYQLSYVRLLSKFVENKGSTWQTCTFQPPSSIERLPQTHNFQIVQNKNLLQIFGGNFLQTSIYNANGKLLLKKQSNSGNMSIDLKTLPNGIYIAQITNGLTKENRVIANF